MPLLHLLFSPFQWFPELLASSPRTSPHISNFAHRSNEDLDRNRASSALYMYERVIEPDDRAVTDLTLSFLHTAFKHLSCMSPPSSAESLTQDTLDSMTSGLKSLLTAPLVVIATGQWGVGLLGEEVRAPDRTCIASVFHFVRRPLRYSRWECRAFGDGDDDSDGGGREEGDFECSIGVRISSNQGRNNSSIEGTIRNKNKEGEKYMEKQDGCKNDEEERDRDRERKRERKNGSEEGSQSVGFGEHWRLLFGWWLDLTDRLEEQKRLYGHLPLTPSIAQAPGSPLFFSPTCNDERDRDRDRDRDAVVRSDFESKGRRSTEKDDGDGNEDWDGIDGNEDGDRGIEGNKRRKTDVRHINVKLLIDLLSIPPDAPLPNSPLPSFSLSPTRTYLHLNPIPRNPHNTRPSSESDPQILKILYPMCAPVMEHGGVMPFRGTGPGVSEFPICCPDLLVSLDIISGASDVLHVSCTISLSFFLYLSLSLSLPLCLCLCLCSPLTLSLSLYLSLYFPLPFCLSSSLILHLFTSSSHS